MEYWPPELVIEGPEAFYAGEVEEEIDYPDLELNRMGN